MKIKLYKVRLSFPALFKAKSVNGSEPKYGASFLLSKAHDAQQIDSLRAAIKEVAKERWPTKLPAGIKVCLHDGSEKDYDGYGPEVMFVSASSSKPIVCVDEALNKLEDGTSKLYAGCYVNVSMRLWVQDNQFGKRVNAQLLAVQHAADGESFGAGPVNAEEEFGKIERSIDSVDTAAAEEALPF